MTNLTSSALPLLVLYGSQTGNAESIAREVFDQLQQQFKQQSNHVQLYSMEAYIKQDETLKQLSQYRCIINVISTTGQGDAPDNAARFIRVLRKQLTSSSSSSFLAGVKYAVLALGDTNYTDFCKPGTRLDTDYNKLGATRLMKLAKADDATRLEDTVEPWKSQLSAQLTSLNNTISASLNDLSNVSAIQPVSSSSSSSTFSTPSPASSAVQSNHKPSAAAAAILAAQQKMRMMQLARTGQLPVADPPATQSPSGVPQTITPPQPSTTQSSSHPNITSQSISSLFPLLIVFGSQTGNADSISREINALLKQKIPQQSDLIHLSSMEAFVKQDESLAHLTRYRCVLSVISTTGSGDAPDNAVRFLRSLRKCTTISSDILYAVLALGDSSYPDFCKPGIRLDAEFNKLGATRLLPLAKADDGAGLEETVEPWKEHLIQKLTDTSIVSTFSSPSSSSSSISSTISSSSTSSTSTASLTPVGSSPVTSTTDKSSFQPSAAAQAILAAQQKMRTMQLSKSGQPLPQTSAPSQQVAASLNTSPTTSQTSSNPVIPSVSTSSSSCSSISPSLIIYGSQTGNSESIAKECFDLWNDRFSGTCRVMSMTQFLSQHDNSVDRLADYKLIFGVISTTGNGDAPDNATKFLRLLKKKSDSDSKWLANVRCCVLGLGDTNYDNFGAIPIRLDRDLQKGGAVTFLKREIADDAVGLSIVVEPFKQKLIQAVQDNVGENHSSNTVDVSKPKASQSLSNSTIDAVTSLPTISMSAPSITIPLSSPESVDPLTDSDLSLIKPKVKVTKPIGLARFHPCRVQVTHLTESRSNDLMSSESNETYFDRRWRSIDVESVLKGYTPEAPFMARVSKARYLTTPLCHSESRRVIHMELELPHSGASSVDYAPGDSIGVYCVNSQQLVNRVAQRLKLTLADVVDVSAIDESMIKEVTAEHQSVHAAAPTPVSRMATASPLPFPAYSADQTIHHSPVATTVRSSCQLPHIASPCTINDILLYCVDLTSRPKKTLLRMLAEYCHDAADKAALFHLASHGGKRDFDAFISEQKYGLLDLLERFPSCAPPLAYVLDHLPALQPRYYSITSSPLCHASTVHIAFTLVDRGVCTNWLTQVCQQAGVLPVDDFTARDGEMLCGVQRDTNGELLIPMFMRRTHTFKLPSQLSTPLICVGPGTGVTPFRSFLFHRQQQRIALESGGVAMGAWRGMDVDIEETECLDTVMRPGYVDRFRCGAQSSRRGTPSDQTNIPASLSAATADTSLVLAPSRSYTSVGRVIMFYGCRAPDRDLLYASDFDELLSDSTLDCLSLAFSRTQSHKIYVQDRIATHRAELYSLINQGAIIYVCGDGGNMAKSVMNAFVQIFEHEAGMDRMAATKAVAELMQQKRYVQDIWS